MERWRATGSVEDAVQAGLSEGEFAHIRELIGRDITVLEVGIFSALYSEHCSYKSTKVHLRTLPSEGSAVVQGPGENAGVVDIGDGEVIAFKIESHNHPSFIEPFQGAATGVGGILRDVFTMGARPIALMNALRFGSPSEARTPHLLRQAVAGIGNYGNCVGIPTVGGELMFDEAYNGNCLVNAFALGIADKDKIFFGRASGVGNALVYVGSKTGRDGIHGATMSSETFDEGSDEKRPTVQVGDPFQEKLLIEACLEAMAKGLVLGIQDMGAAGMTSSSYEIADRGGVGLRINLDRVPQREENMNPYEIMLSESQERMLLVADTKRLPALIEIFSRWGLDAVQIGEVTPGPDVELVWHGETISSLAPSVLTRSVPQYRWPEHAPSDYELRATFKPETIPPPDDLSKFFLDFLGSLNVCSRRPVFRQYDSTVRTNTVIHPGGDAAVVRVKRRDGSGKEKGIALTVDCNSRYCSIDPRQGVALSLAEACRNIAAVGATPLALSDCLNFGSPQKPDGMWQIAESIRGLGEAARAFGIPVVSGNVSLNNETKGRAVLPTPELAVVGLMPDAALAVPIYFAAEGDRVFVIGETDEREIGGSEFLAVHAGISKGALPRLNYDLEMKTAECVRALINGALLRSCHDLSAGGLAVAMAESCFSPRGIIGASIDPTDPQSARDPAGALFAETGARFLISCKRSNEAKVQKLLAVHGLRSTWEGTVGGSSVRVGQFLEVGVEKAHARWSDGLCGLMGEK